MAQWGGDGSGTDQLAGPARARRQCDHDMPTAKMAATLNRPSHEIAATFSIGNQPQLATSQKNAARNALASSRPSPPMERKVSRRQTTHPISRMTPTKTVGGRHPEPAVFAQE